jgi:hypothetical protein
VEEVDRKQQGLKTAMAATVTMAMTATTMIEIMMGAAAVDG